jgi:hypothetical protein
VTHDRRVDFLVEVCDPCEDAAFAYQVNGITVSDFYMPHFFDPLPAPNVRYSFSGAIAAPRTVLRGGYLTWHDPMDEMENGEPADDKPKP